MFILNRSYDRSPLCRNTKSETSGPTRNNDCARSALQRRQGSQNYSRSSRQPCYLKCRRAAFNTREKEYSETSYDPRPLQISRTQNPTTPSIESRLLINQRHPTENAYAIVCSDNVGYALHLQCVHILAGL